MHIHAANRWALLALSSSTCCPPLRTESSTDCAHITGHVMQMCSSSRRSNRLSTASSGDDSFLLPSLHIQPAISLNPLADVNPSLTSEGVVSRKTQTVLEDDFFIIASRTVDQRPSNNLESDCGPLSSPPMLPVSGISRKL